MAGIDVEEVFYEDEVEDQAQAESEDTVALFTFDGESYPVIKGLKANFLTDYSVDLGGGNYILLKKVVVWGVTKGYAKVGMSREFSLAKEDEGYLADEIIES